MKELRSELEAARAELALARTARASLTVERHTVERGRLEDYSAEIRHLTQEKATLQAQCDMARAHLKALSGMLKSSVSQVRSKQEMLCRLLRQTEEDEARALEDAMGEDDEERSLKERLRQLSTFQENLDRSEEHSGHMLTLTETEATRTETNKLEEAAALLEDTPVAQLQLSQLRQLRSFGTSLVALDALIEVQENNEELKRSSQEARLEHLKSEVAERQSHFDRMTDDLLAQVSNLKEVVHAVPEPSSERQLRRLSDELSKLRHQEQHLEQIESKPPEPLARVEPSLPDRLPRKLQSLERRRVGAARAERSQDSRTVFEERVEELKAIIGASLQSLEESDSD